MHELRRTELLAVPASLDGWQAWGVTRPASPWDGDLPICRTSALVQRGPEDADADLLEKLGLLEGHLIVGRRLLEANEARLAVPHFGHPIRELYTYLEPRLSARGAPHFEAELAVMEAHAEGGQTGTGGRFGPAWDAVLPKIAAARATVPAAKRANNRFMLSHIGLMVYNVASDYGESIERGRIVNIVEYHDSMGFLAYARAVAEAKSGSDWAAALTEIVALENEAYPRLLPNPRPQISISAARARALRVQAIADAIPA